MDAKWVEGRAFWVEDDAPHLDQRLPPAARRPFFPCLLVAPRAVDKCSPLPCDLPLPRAQLFGGVTAVPPPRELSAASRSGAATYRAGCEDYAAE
jgi:hypothetical protein